MLSICSNKVLNKSTPFFYNGYFKLLSKYRYGGITLEKIIEIQRNQDSIYSPVKLKYPPGTWENNNESAWRIHEYANDLLKIPTAKERLEFLSGTEPRPLYYVKAVMPRPRNLEFTKLITKTCLIEKLPKDIEQIAHVDLTNGNYKHINNLFKEENINLFNRSKSSFNNYTDFECHLNTHCNIRSLLNASISLLSNNDYILESHLDEKIRLECSWKVGGFTGVEKAGDGSWELAKTLNDKDAGILHFQFKHLTDFQIRTINPLNKFVPIADPICTIDNKWDPLCAPEAVQISLIKEKPINISGHWIGSPYKFCLGSIQILPAPIFDKFSSYGSDFLIEAELNYALMAMFGTCLSQAYNQGFCDVLDLTYPITSQCLLFSGNTIRHCAFQLNTIQIWNRSNKFQNLMWISDSIKLCTDPEIDLNKLKFNPINHINCNVNKNAINLVIRFLSLQPMNRKINLIPYLPDAISNNVLESYINLKNEQPLEHPVIGRFQYPRGAIYF